MTDLRIPLVELCVEDVAGSRIGVASGVDRIELCRDLSCGGLTPAFDEILAAARTNPRQGLRILVRENPTTYALSDQEVSRLCDTTRKICDLTADLGGEVQVPVGIVIGSITDNGFVDAEVLARFRNAAGNRPLTFHRAFDQVADQGFALEALIDSGFDSVLTTGGDLSRAQPDQLRRLSQQAGGRIEIIASGGLRSYNVNQITSEAHAAAVHMRAPLDNGGTDAEEVRAIISELGNAQIPQK